MVYKKLTIFTLIISIVAAFTCNFVFAADSVISNDKILDSTLQILIFLQKYSWPIVTLVLYMLSINSMLWDLNI